VPTNLAFAIAFQQLFDLTENDVDASRRLLTVRADTTNVVARIGQIAERVRRRLERLAQMLETDVRDVVVVHHQRLQRLGVTNQLAFVNNKRKQSAVYIHMYMHALPSTAAPLSSNC
jgi:predicted site-specific integrase-resolvase